MVNFGKQLEGQLIPEWQDAYCNYDELKRDLKRIMHHRGLGPTFSRTGSLGLLRSLVSFKQSPTGASTISFSPRGNSRDVIVVHKRIWHEDGDVYETQLLEPLTHSPQDKTFFARLDSQLNKINRFYRKKEGENITRAGVLEKQLLALINMQEVLARQSLESNSFSNHGYGAGSDESPERRAKISDELPLIADELKSNEYPLQTFPMRPSTINEEEHQVEAGEFEHVIQDYIDQVAATNLRARRSFSRGMTSRDEPDLEIALPAPSVDSVPTPSPSDGRSKEPSPGSRSVRFTADTQDKPVKISQKSAIKKTSLVIEPVARSPHSVLGLDEMERGEHLSEIDVEAPPDDQSDDQKQDIVLTQKKLEEARKLLRIAFVEFYRGLGLLQSYRSLNMMALSKIMKKYDKITRWNISPLYMKEVESSYFVTSGKIQKLITKVEDLYTKQFAEGVRKKAITHLRPVRLHASHRTTFFIGLNSGCSIALLIAFIFLVVNPMALKAGGGAAYLNSVFPVFSTLLLVIFHIYLYAWNVYAWNITRINYPFIFEFSPGTELRYREVLLVSTGLTTLLLGGMCIHVAVSTVTFPEQAGADSIPLIIVLLFVVVLFLPFNYIYRSSRVFFLRCLQHLICSPFYKVVLSDFFLGDQFTSQVLVFRNIEYITCYYTSGYFLSQNSQACRANSVFRGFAYVMALLPYWWRFLQCLRRYYDERDAHQLQNAGKYFSAMIAVIVRQTYAQQFTVTWRLLFIFTSIFATAFALYWDLCVDWGLLHRHSRNKWLRDKLILKRKYLYFVAMVMNTVLRLAWLFSLERIAIPGFNQNAFDVIAAGLEVFRRGIWNFFRIENEHLNNVGKYRAVKAVPLPFSDAM